MSGVADDYTADEVDAMTFGADASAPWDSEQPTSNASDLFLMSANLAGASGSELHSLHQSMFRNDYSLQSLQQQQRRPQQQQQQQAPVRSSDPADDIASLLSRFENSSASSALAAGGSLSGLNEFEEFDTRALRMVDDLADAADEEEVAAAKSAASAWGQPPANFIYSNYATAAGGVGPTTPAKSPSIPAPGASPAPLPAPQNTPAKGAVSLEELEKQLKAAGATAGAVTSQPAPTGNPQLDGLPQALHHLVLSGQTAPQGYQGPALPHFQHGTPAPQGLSVDDHERQHFYIPLPRSHNGLGFMTKSEVALVFRIQLSQLQSIGNALSDDFYYQVMQARKGGKVNASGQAILPVFKSGQARNEDGSPKLPEGTLGRISAFSIHKPKKLMAISDASSSSTAEEPIADDQPRKSNMFAGRTLNYLIEEGYRAAMDLEDVDALLASLAPQRYEDPVRAFDRQRLGAQRAELCTRLLESLDLDEIHLRMNEVASGDHLIFKFFALPKGRLLIYRSLVLLNPPNTYQLVDVLLHDLTQVAMPTTPAPSTDEKLIHLISDLIYSMPLLPYANEIFSYFLSAKHSPRLIELMRTAMVCNFLQVLFKKGHEAQMVLQQNPHMMQAMSVPGVPGIRETVQQWRAIFDAITERIRGQIHTIFDGLPKDAKPTLPPTASQLAAKARREKEEKKAAAAAGAGAADKKDAEKKEEKKDDKSADEKKESEIAKNSNLSTRFSMWELMAAFFSHANESQRVWLNVELKDVLVKEVESLYGEYRERKEKQAAAQAEKEATEAAAAKEADAKKDEEKPPTDKEATSVDDKKEDKKESRGPRGAHIVPPASSLPPPPSPALRFLSAALLGDQSAEFQAIAKTWNDLHQDYAYYQMKHQQKVQQEQARLAQQQHMRSVRQQQQRQQWNHYQGQQQQQRGGQGGPSSGASPHQHFHSPSPVGHRGGHQGGPSRGPMRRDQQPTGSPQQAPYQPDQPTGGAPKPVPVWVKPGTSGANVAKTPVKAPASAAAAPSPAK